MLFIFVNRDYEPKEKDIEESRIHDRVTNLESLKGPKTAVMDGKTRYLDGMERNKPVTISDLGKKQEQSTE